jgi:hypothetical protein
MHSINVKIRWIYIAFLLGEIAGVILTVIALITVVCMKAKGRI